MYKDVKSSREISDEIENLPTSPSGHRPPNQPSSGLSRDPLHSIPDPTQALKPTVVKEVGFKARVETTPTKPKGKAADALPHFRTPEKQGNGTFPKNRFGWSATESRNEMANYLGQSSRNGGSLNMTPRTTRATTVGRPSSHTETTPTKSVSKPPNGGFAPISSSRVPASYSRNGNYAALSRGLPVCNGLPMVVNTVEVPHFDLKEDPSFWIHHNVQVIIRVRPLNSAERGVQGYNRCVKQESSQNITWIGQPESRFTFDHVACETVDQEMLFRKAGLPMVENCLSGYNSCMFAYGQTGSGKTYTMLGDIDDLEFKPSLHRGMTPRIFEYLFARIRAEEESRRDDQLKYSCKCSFLEIYNEQITDLLNPSSTNLLLREDMRKGIYVENLSEFEVYYVGDILNLLAQGSLNRKVAATNMNMESSRSHSVFTCVIESKWERDSTTNLRFARLNLVDLAGSERQKTSGAEGERLKEAANINKSLSTLGHVIMVLVDVANGKIRHVPYRDSKLTFLLQESLGGNSKTIIIANISPSTGCASETLNTLKFAQRAKLIQNNAIVNEDSSGDVSALQHQIRLLKEELSALKRQPVSRSLSFGPLSLQYNTEYHEDVDMEIDQPLSDDSVQFEAEAMKMSPQQLQSLEKIVAGALRREQIAETFIKKLEAEIEHLNRLVHQREEDARCSKMKLKFREDKIRRMDSLLKGVQPVDSYLLEENASLSEEMQMLQEKVDRNPEVTRFALENIRLLEQVKRYQDFYEEGEREILLSEVSELRDKLIQHFHENNKQSLRSNIPIAAKDPTVPEEKEKCEDPLKPAEEFLNLELELDIMKIILKEERSSRAKADELGTCLSRELKLAEESIMSIRKQYEDVNEQLKEAKSTIGALKSQQLLSTNELEDLKHKNRQYVELLHKQELELVAFKQQTCHGESNDCLVFKGGKRDETLFQRRIENMQASLEKAKMLNVSYQRDHVFQKANEEEMDVIRQQVEEETAQVILSLQEELSALQQQVQDCCWKEKEVESRLVLLETTLSQQQEAFNALTCENEALREQMKEKEKDVELVSKEWELLSSEIEGALTDGHEALIDASEQLDSICSYVPKKGRWISEQVHKLIKQASEKELVIEDLNACLENANARLSDMECMLRSLKGAAMVITESHQKECSEKEKEIHRLRSELSAKSTANLEMESKNSIAYDEMRKASKCATVAFIIMSRLSEISSGHLDSLKHIELQLNGSIESNQMKDGLLDKCAAASEDAERQIESLRKELESAEECCHRLGAELAKQQAYISVKERQLEEYHELDISMTREKLSELQEGVSTMKSCMNTYAEHTANINMQISELVDGSKYAWLDNSESREEYHVYNNSVGCPIDDESSSTLEACSDNLIHEDVKENEKSTKTCRGGISKDATVTLLRKEIESALESLKEVQAEVIRLNAEKQELCISERQSRIGMGMVKAQISHILATFGDFEDRCLYKIKVLNQKVEQVEQHAEEATRLWCQAKEMFEGELSNATADVAKKTAEASCFFSKFEEAQDIMKEADVMIKGLMIANETMKLEIKDLKRANLSLSSERDGLVQDIQDLHSYTAVNDQQCHELLQELEMVISQARCTSEEAVLSMSADILSVKYQLFDSRRLIHLWLEDAWSEIIVKDSAFSVLHLCHKGILLEAVTGLSAENFLLSNRLCDSDAMISHLREQNIKSVQELEAFNVLKGKLLADIKRSFDCVTSKENETEELGAKLRAFESKITDLQLQEELMLERSNYLGFELANLVKDLNHSNSDTLASLLEQEKLLNDSKEATISQEESLMMELLAKDLELVIMTSELQQLADEKADMETNQVARNTVLEHLKKKFVTLSFTSNLMQQLMLERDAEVIQLQKEVGKAELHLTRSSADIIYLDVVNTALNEELVLQKEIAFLNEKLDYELREALADKEKLSEHLHKVEIEYSNVADKLKTLEGEFQSSCGRLLALDQQKQDLDNELKMKDEQLSKMKFLEQENLSLKEKLDELKSQSSMLITDVQEKDSEVKSCQDHIHILVSEKCRLQESIHDMESKISFLQEDLDLRDAEVIQLQKEVGEAELQLTRSCADIILLDVVNIALNEELVLQKEIAFLNEKLDYELREALADKEKLSEHLHKVEIEYSNVADKLKTLEGEFQSSCGRLLALDQQKQDLDNELKMKDEQLSKMKFLEQENHSLKEKLDELKSQSSMLITDVQEKDSEVKSCQDHIHILVSEKCRLQENIHDMESKISFLQEDLDLRKADLKELQYSHSSANEELCQKSQELQNHVMKMDTLEEENLSLKNELSLLRLCKFEDLRLTSSSVTKCLNLTKAAEMESHRMSALLNDKIEIVSDRLSQDICGNLEAVAKIEEMLEPLDTIAETIISENSTLQAELLRKDDVLKGLLFDLSLLQESASSTKDQKDEIEELTASLNYKEDELKTKVHEFDDVVAHVHQLEAQMKEKIDKILLLERDLSTKTNAVELFSKEKADLTSHVDEILAAKVTLERELNEKKKLVESLEIEIVDMEKSVDQANVSIESLKSELEEVSSDRDHMHEELRDLEEKLDTAQALSEEYEAIAMEAKQIAESNRIYGEEKEEEVKLLEKSVHELDRTVDVLENKVDILGEEAERQRLQREELEMELDSLKYQIHNLKSADSDVKRHLDEKGQNLEKALKHMQKLEKDLANKDTEISHCKAHITELNLHAEAQASEYKKKFKALEAMAGQVKTEGPSSHGKSSSSNKLEKNATKPRGSGSPFKCIGIGLAQQLKLEKDEEFTAERLRIQELEALAANRQKEIFVLNNRLAAAESMTHDVIRDLLGVKLDMTNYVSLLDKQQVQKIAESAQLDNVDSEVKVEEISKLKKLLSDFVEERKGWLEEIDRRQAELLTAQLALEKLHQRDRSLTAENEVLKVDVEKYKKKVVKLEGEVNKLSGQQNLHQRIHHHAKIKEENNILKRQNEELSARLQRAETLLMRMKEGLAGLRATNVKVNYIDFDEEKCLSNKLKEAEEERVQLAQELLGLCTSILKAAGVKKASSDISVASAEEALEQLRSKFTSLERELENLKLKSRIENERIRLSGIIMQSPPLRPRAEDNCTTPKRTLQSPFFSAVDR